MRRITQALHRMYFFSRRQLVALLMFDRTNWTLYVPDFVGRIFSGVCEELARPGVPVRNVAGRGADQS